MLIDVDLAASMVLVSGLMAALGALAAASASAGHLVADPRVEREDALPVVGRLPMHAVYRALRGTARALVAVHVTANAVTGFSILAALAAAAAFALGHFGLGALLTGLSAAADAVDGLVARASKTASPLGRVLDTTVDRYVDAILLGGIALYVRRDAFLLVLVLAALLGSFMVSYASAIERELGPANELSPMRRSHRLVYLITGAMLDPLLTPVLEEIFPAPERGATVLVAVAVIAVVANLSAVRRLAAAASRGADAARSAGAEGTSGGPDCPRRRIHEGAGR